jgi:hypothetical protein
MEEVALKPASNGTCHQLQDGQGVRPNCAADLLALAVQVLDSRLQVGHAMNENNSRPKRAFAGLNTLRIGVEPRPCS